MNDDESVDDCYGNIPLLDQLTNPDQCDENVSNSDLHTCFDNCESSGTSSKSTPQPNTAQYLHHGVEHKHTDEGTHLLPLPGPSCSCQSSGSECAFEIPSDIRHTIGTLEDAFPHVFDTGASAPLLHDNHDTELLDLDLVHEQSTFSTVTLESFEADVVDTPVDLVTESSYTHLVKQELNCKVQIGRLRRGESEMILQPETPKKYELREDEIWKKNRRLEQNRQSANKARVKSHLHLKDTLKKLNMAIADNNRLKSELSCLKQEKSQLAIKLKLHFQLCLK